MSQEKANKFFVYGLSLISLASIMSSYWGAVIMVQNAGFEPSYGLFFQSLLANLFLIILLNIDRVAFVAYLYFIFSEVDSFINTQQLFSINPLAWFHKMQFQFGFSLILGILTLIFSVLGLGVWIRLKFYKGKSS